MPRRILLADDPGPVVIAVKRDLEERGCEVEAVAPAAAVEKAAQARYDAVLVHCTRRSAGVVAALRAADPLLPVIALFLDRREAEARASVAESADGILVGPLTASSVGSLCAFAGKLRDASERAARAETALARREPPGGGDLAFLKKLLFVEVKRSKRYGYPVSLALLEVDGWEGDASKLPARERAALRAGLLGTVTASLRDIDLAVPFSAERLVVLMPHTSAQGGLRVARRLCATVRDRKGSPALTVSVGVATHGGDGTVSFAGLVKRAGDALARARAAGGDRAEPADPVKKRDRISIG
ncbi:MAG TPA: diguanylate cyclase [Anaeromyxobacteraceae bacterium]|nr:diguanylate cyclase [Anaeromyxobacteraceae bacterium]